MLVLPQPSASLCIVSYSVTTSTTLLTLCPTAHHLVADRSGTVPSTIRPVRQVVHSIPFRRRSTVEAMLVARRGRRTSSSTVAVTNTSEYERYRKRSSSDANRLSSIMGFLPLREAFGEFCRRSLCGEVYE